MHGVCGDGECQNIPGSFVCKCKEGYETSQLMQICMGKFNRLQITSFKNIFTIIYVYIQNV